MAVLLQMAFLKSERFDVLFSVRLVRRLKIDINGFDYHACTLPFHKCQTLVISAGPSKILLHLMLERFFRGIRLNL